MFRSKMQGAVKSAESALREREKLSDAITKEQEKLQGLILVRRAAEVALVDAEAAESLSESVDVAGARVRVEGAKSDLDRQGVKLAGLRMRMAQQSAALSEQRGAIKGELPAYAEKVKSDFGAQWAAAVAVFSALMGKRKVLEALIGRMALPEPSPIGADSSGEEFAPYRLIERLEGEIERVAGWRRCADWPELDAVLPGPHWPFDPAKIYRLTQECENLPVGALVVEASFVPGMLSRFVSSLQFAVPADAEEWKEKLAEAGMAGARITAEQERDREEQRQAQDANRVGSYDLEKAREAAAANLRVTEQGQYGRPIPAPAGKEQPSAQPRRVIGGF